MLKVINIDMMSLINLFPCSRVTSNALLHLAKILYPTTYRYTNRGYIG